VTAKQRSGLLRLFAEFFAVLIVAAALSYAGHALVVSRGHEHTPAMFKLREPVHAVFEIILPMIVGAFMVRFFGRRQNLSHVIWREPEFVAPELGGKAPTYAPPLDTSDDILMGSALSSEPEPFYDLHVQPRISRLWWLIGTITSLAAVLIIISGFVQAEIAPGAAVTGMIAAFAWAFTQEYLLRGLVVAEMRRISRRARWTFIMSALLSTIWMIPIAITAASSSRILVLILLGPLLTLPTYALRRMFTTLWAPIVAQFLFISVFFVLI
jgi:hypothetical protein